ncbi:unnamed protein product [Caenorhabditis sp. 36 PRJEB53466]|nr:unnamed protein product [Caenorhabditis sp. 36 PRJEB53466]
MEPPTQQETEFHKKTTEIVLKLLQESNLPLQTIQLDCFRDLCHHLNPLSKVPTVEKLKDNDDALLLLAVNSRRDGCLICAKKVGSEVFLRNVIDAFKVLVPHVYFGDKTLGEAKRRILEMRCFRMCKVHIVPVYEKIIRLQSMINAYDISTGDSPPGYNILRQLTHLRNRRNTSAVIQLPLLQHFKNNYFKLFLDSFSIHLTFWEKLNLSYDVKVEPPMPVTNSAQNQSNVINYRPCFICHKKTTPGQMTEISNIENVFKILVPTVYYGQVSMKKGKEIVMGEGPYLMCMSHIFLLLKLTLSLQAEIQNVAFRCDSSFQPGYEALRALKAACNSAGHKTSVVPRRSYIETYFKGSIKQFVSALDRSLLQPLLQGNDREKNIDVLKSSLPFETFESLFCTPSRGSSNAPRASISGKDEVKPKVGCRLDQGVIIKTEQTNATENVVEQLMEVKQERFQ